MDCAVIPLNRHKDYLLVQTVDFFYPMVNDPELLGRIAIANVLSDVFAVGVTDFDSVEIIVSTSTSFTKKEQDVVISLIIAGFQNSLQANGYHKTPLVIRQLKINPWCIVGGIATSVCRSGEIILPSNAQPGDVLVLTKPLGGQMAMDAHLWQLNQNEKYTTLLSEFSDDDIRETFQIAVKSMTYLNKNAALLMHKYQAHCATDITGFGLLGHAQNLAQFQKQKVLFKIDQLPIIKNVHKLSLLMGQSTKLRSGRSVETSGGLLISLSPDAVDKFCRDFEEVTNGEQKSFKIGHVVASSESDAVLSDEVEFIEVSL
ncbi:hypothetical protein M5D96_004761 [Drosophila gunungcola]|uniref:Selenide, water dikinase 2 n=2 Tax=Drosophila gunungcola TaxID=103775 RepID=A0A9Q0BTP1_9MUSC|nr:hypothetical protein M5D96_004761 [Drosophila gunungcola]